MQVVSKAVNTPRLGRGKGRAVALTSQRHERGYNGKHDLGLQMLRLVWQASSYVLSAITMQIFFIK